MTNDRNIVAQVIRQHSVRYMAISSSPSSSSSPPHKRTRLVHHYGEHLHRPEQMPDDVWIHCMLFVDSVRTLYTLQRTCRRLHTLIASHPDPSVTLSLWQRMSSTVFPATISTINDDTVDLRRQCVLRMWERYLGHVYTHYEFNKNSNGNAGGGGGGGGGLWRFDRMGQSLQDAFESDEFQRQVWHEVFHLMYHNRSALDEGDLSRAPLVYEALKNDADGEELFVTDVDRDGIKTFRPQIEFDAQSGRFAKQWDFRGRRVVYEGEPPQERKYVMWSLDSEGRLAHSFNEDLCEGDVEPEHAVAEGQETGLYRSQQIAVYPFTRTCTVLGMPQRVTVDDVAYVVCYVPHAKTVDEANSGRQHGQIIVRLRTGPYARSVANLLTVSMERECGFFIVSKSLLSLFGMDCSRLFE